MAAYIEAGRALTALAAREGVDVRRAASLVNDTLIAASSREADVHVVTENVGDFPRIQRQLRGFRFSAASELLGA